MNKWNSSVLALLLFAHAAAAYNDQDVVNFSVSGNITQSICSVTVPGRVDLGVYARQDLAFAGAHSANIPFTINLTGCTQGLTRATVTFTGMPYDDGSWGSVIYANQADAGAQGIGLQIYNADGASPVNLANGVSYTFPVDAQTAGGNLTLIARLYSPEGKSTAGEFSSAVTLNFIYN
ncbi:S-fimbrial adhesin protein SfaS precursor [compost metagenome]